MDKPEKKSGLALAGVIIGAIALALSAVPIINNFAFVLAALAFFFGVVGLRRARKHGGAGRGRAMTAVILAVVAVVVVIASQSFYGSTLDKAGKEIDKSVNNASGKNTDQLLKNEVTAKLGTFVATTDQYGIVSTELPVTLTNKASTKQSYSVKIEAVDSTGKRIDDDTVYADDLTAGQSQDFKAFQYVTSDKVDALKTATFKVLSVSQY